VATSIASAADWEEPAQACIARMQDEEQRSALQERADFVGEVAHAEAWNARVYGELPARLADSDHPHDRLLLRWLTWAEEARAAGIEDDPVAAATAVDHSRSLAILADLAASGSDDPLVLAATLIACPASTEGVTGPAAELCGDELDRRFQAADPDNAYPVLQAAQRHWVRGDKDPAYAALARLVDTDHIDWYFGASQRAVAERLSHHLGDDHDADELSLMAQTLGPQIVGYPGYLPLSQLCDAETVAGQNGRIELCVGAVEALAGDGAALMDRRVATALAARLAPALVRTPRNGLEEWARLTNRDLEELQARVAGVGCLALEQGPDAYQSLYGEAYLEDVAEVGEYRAQQRLVERFEAAASDGRKAATESVQESAHQSAHGTDP